MSKTIGIVAVLVIVVIGGYFLFRSQGAPMSPTSTETPMASTSAAPSSSMDVSTSPSPSTAGVKTFTITGSNFAFDVKEIKVNKGDTVKIIFQNSGGMHDWVLDEFNVRTPRLEGGQSAEVTFVANKTGTFEYYCSVGTHRAMGMKGMLIVQ